MALEFASRDCRYEQVLLLCRGTSEHADAPGRDLVDGNWIELERPDFGCRIVGEAQNSLLLLIIFSLNYGLGPFLLKLWGEPVTVSASLTVWSNKQGEVGKIDENWAEAESKMVGCESDCDGLILAMFVSCFFRLCLCLLWQCLKSFSLFSVIVVVVPHPRYPSFLSWPPRIWMPHLNLTLAPGCSAGDLRVSSWDGCQNWLIEKSEW